MNIGQRASSAWREPQASARTDVRPKPVRAGHALDEMESMQRNALDTMYLNPSLDRQGPAPPAEGYIVMVGILCGCLLPAGRHATQKSKGRDALFPAEDSSPSAPRPN